MNNNLISAFGRHQIQSSPTQTDKNEMIYSRM